jgi:hypothetical protein
MAPEVVARVKLNKHALLAFWNEGDTWMKEAVDAHLDGLAPVP